MLRCSNTTSLIDRRTDGRAVRDPPHERGSAHLDRAAMPGRRKGSAAHRMQPSPTTHSTVESPHLPCDILDARTPRHSSGRSRGKRRVEVAADRPLPRPAWRLAGWCDAAKSQRDATPAGPTPMNKMQIAKNSVELAVFVFFFYNFSTIRGLPTPIQAICSPDPVYCRRCGRRSRRVGPSPFVPFESAFQAGLVAAASLAATLQTDAACGQPASPCRWCTAAPRLSRAGSRIGTRRKSCIAAPLGLE